MDDEPTLPVWPFPFSRLLALHFFDLEESFPFFRLFFSDSVRADRAASVSSSTRSRNEAISFFRSSGGTELRWSENSCASRMPVSGWSEEELVLLIEEVEFMTAMDPLLETGLSSGQQSSRLSRSRTGAPDRDGRPLAPLPRPVTDPPSSTMVAQEWWRRNGSPVMVQLAKDRQSLTSC